MAVDDGSADGSWSVLQDLSRSDPRIKVFRHEANQGKGAALRTGITHAASPIVLIQDADLEYDPAEYPALIQPIVAGKADVVFGSRFAGRTAPGPVLLAFGGQQNSSPCSPNMATNLNLTDMESCYKVFRLSVLQRIHLEENRFGFEPEITAKVARLGVVIFEVPISYSGRT